MEKEKINMNKKKFRIGELSDKLKIKKFVIRFWEKEFELKSNRSGGGQRFYTQDDLETFIKIKELLYKKKFTIPGAKKALSNFKNKNLNPAITQKFSSKKKIISKSKIPNEFLLTLNKLKKQLLNFEKQL